MFGREGVSEGGRGEGGSEGGREGVRECSILVSNIQLKHHTFDHNNSVFTVIYEATYCISKHALTLRTISANIWSKSLPVE